MRKLRTLSVAWAGIVLACSSTQTPAAKGPSEGASNLPAGPVVDMTRCDPKASNHRVQNLDTNADGKPDVWKIYGSVNVGGQNQEVLLCKQVDLNHDGKVDELVVYNDNGTRVLERFDLDFDQKFDVTIFYEGGKRVREELDTNFDDKTDVWKFYEGDRLVRVELDRNHDGKVDTWEYFEGGKLDRIGYDTTGSGQVEKWDRAPSESSLPEAGAPAAGAQPASDTAAAGDEGKPAAPAPPPTDGAKAPAPAAKKKQ
jgi:hypothetical protein